MLLPNMQQIVVCAAIRNVFDPTIVVSGARHGNCFNTAILLKVYDVGKELYADESYRWEDGFIDQDNHFMTRAEAWKVADAAGQIRVYDHFSMAAEDYRKTRPAGIGDEGFLHSENLY